MPVRYNSCQIKTSSHRKLPRRTVACLL